MDMEGYEYPENPHVEPEATEVCPTLIVIVLDDGTIEMMQDAHPTAVRRFYEQASQDGVEPAPDLMDGEPLESRLLPYTLCG
jgi:hypothetical protein